MFLLGASTRGFSTACLREADPLAMAEEGVLPRAVRCGVVVPLEVLGADWPVTRETVLLMV